MPQTLTPRFRRFARGFTLTELAIVMVIVGLLGGGLLMTVSASRDVADAAEVQKQLTSINEALAGFAAAQGRLPCPALVIDAPAFNSMGQEAFCASATGACAPTTTVPAHGRCASHFGGFLPAAALGLWPTDEQGFAIDRWGQRIRYAVSSDPTSATMASNAAGTQRFSFTATDGMKSTGLGNLHPDLHVCEAGPGSASKQCNGTRLTDAAVAVVFSPGRNGAASPSGSDEAENATSSGDRVFVSKPMRADFDDFVVWVSPHILYSRLISAGRLP